MLEFVPKRIASHEQGLIQSEDDVLDASVLSWEDPISLRGHIICTRLKVVQERRA